MNFSPSSGANFRFFEKDVGLFLYLSGVYKWRCGKIHNSLLIFLRTTTTIDNFVEENFVNEDYYWRELEKAFIYSEKGDSRYK